MLSEQKNSKTSLCVVVLCIMIPLLILMTGCASNKLVDQKNDEMKKIVESLQGDFAEDGWTYTGYEVIKTDNENDIATIAIAYDVDGDSKKLLKKNTNSKPKNNYIYGLAEKINVKANVELSEFDHENNTVKSELKTTEWFVGKTEANSWIEDQNKKWKKVGEKIPFTTKNGSLEVTIDGASKTDWYDSDSSYMASVRATIKNIEYKEPIYEEGVCQYDILDNKDIVVTTEDGISCSGGDTLGPTDGAYDPDTKVGQGETARVCLEIIVPKDTKNVILKFGDEAYLYLPIDQKTISY